MAKGAGDLARILAKHHGAPALGRVLNARPIAGGVVAIVSEQEAAPIQGNFEVVALRWRDITAHTFTGHDPAMLGGAGEMIEFMQVGIKVLEDPDRVVLMHSMSLEPGRSEYFVFPRGVILQEDRIGTVTVSGSSFKGVGGR